MMRSGEVFRIGAHDDPGMHLLTVLIGMEGQLSFGIDT